MAREHRPAAGVHRGVVTDNKDPEGLARVRVSVPGLEPGETPWASVAAPMAGDRRGTYFLPEVGDEVLVAFAGGDPRAPYVLGALWGPDARPPEDNADGGNHRRAIRSRSGHVIRLDDTPSAERIELVAASGAGSIAIDASAGSLAIEARGDVTIRSTGGTLRLEGVEVELESSGAVRIHGALLELTGDGVTSVNGALVTIN
ncbi:MAG TPA: phage baseplate assembly protein V [Gaiellaceae bacterium]|nr:phage baseplate assembly protein V [Gaiellaceae bacterium]